MKEIFSEEKKESFKIPKVTERIYNKKKYTSLFSETLRIKMTLVKRLPKSAGKNKEWKELQTQNIEGSKEPRIRKNLLLIIQ